MHIFKNMTVRNDRFFIVVWTVLLRVNTLLAVRKEFWKVSRAFLICSLTALIINWGAIVPGQLSTVYSAPSIGTAELTQGCLFNLLNWQLLLTFMWKWSTVPKSRYAWRNTDVHDTILHRWGVHVRSVWLNLNFYMIIFNKSISPLPFLCNVLCLILQRALNINFETTSIEKEVCWCHFLCERQV